MIKERRGLITSIFSKEPQNRFKENLYKQSEGNQIKLTTIQKDNDYKIIESYFLELGKEYRPKIYIAEAKGQSYYLVEEPALNETDKEQFRVILGYIISSMDTKDFDRIRYLEALEKKILEISKEINIKVDDKKVALFSEIIAREILGYSLVQPLISDDNLSDISCSSYNQPIFVKHREYSEYNWMATNITLSEEELDTIVQKIASMYGRGVNILSPHIEIITKEGHRIMLTYKTEISLPSSTFSIRKFPSQPWTIQKIVVNKTINEDIAAYLWHVLEKRQFIIISGPMGSGKTTLLSTLIQLTDPSSKILTIEDAAEIAIGNRPNWQRLISRRVGQSSCQDIGLMELTILSLRTSSDYVALGEVRGAEIQALVQAAGTGLGCITTFHAGNLEELLSRMKGKPLSVGESFLQTIRCVVFLSNIKLANGKQVKRICSIEEPIFRNGRTSSIKILTSYEDVLDGKGIDEFYKRSKLLKKLEDDEDTLNELRRKRNFITQLVDQRINTFNQLHPLLIGFYGGRYGA
ncbi:MAG: ATPase, T2SS/T4P/T4SS family [Nitrososphaeria archaeon]